MLLTFGIIIPVHYASNLVQFSRCLESVLKEKQFIDRIIIAKDGLVPENLNKYIKKLCISGKISHVVETAENIGLGQILNRCASIHADVDYWIRIDSDDWNINERIRRQRKFLEQNPHWDVLHGGIVEISSSNSRHYRKYVDGDLSLYDKNWIRNPINHVSCVLSSRVFTLYGGYSQTLRYSQDFELWARLLSSGGKIYGLPGEPLVEVDVGENIQLKRPNKYMVDEFIALIACYKFGKLNTNSLIVAMLARLFLRRLLPRFLAKLISKKLR